MIELKYRVSSAFFSTCVSVGCWIAALLLADLIYKLGDMDPVLVVLACLTFAFVAGGAFSFLHTIATLLSRK